MIKKNRLNFSQLAPDLTVLDTQGKPVKISSFWAKRPLLLAFTRHFGCTQCKEMLEEIVSGRERIEKSGLDIAIIMQGTPQATAEFAKTFAPGLRCLADPERKAYQAYGLERGTVFQTFLNLKVWKAIRKSQKKGFRVEPPPEGQDAMQLSGMFIIARDGKVLLPYYFDHIADHPPLELLLKGVLSTRWDHTFNGPIGPGVE